MAKKDKDSYYLKHDFNAADDPAIVQMLSVYSWKGYGWYWRFNEILRAQADFKLSLQGKYVYASFAGWMKCDEGEVRQYLNDMFEEFKLYQTDGSCFWSDRIIRDMAVLAGKREQASGAGKESAKKRALEKLQRELGLFPTGVDGNSTDVENLGNGSLKNSNHLILFKEDLTISNYSEGIKILESSYPSYFKDFDFRAVYTDWLKLRALKNIPTLASTVKFFMLQVVQWTQDSPAKAKFIFQYSVDSGYPKLYPPKDPENMSYDNYQGDTRPGHSLDDSYEKVRQQLIKTGNGK